MPGLPSCTAPDRRSRPPIPCADQMTRPDHPSGRVFLCCAAIRALPPRPRPLPRVRGRRITTACGIGANVTSSCTGFVARCVRRCRLNPFVVTQRRQPAATLALPMTDRPAIPRIRQDCREMARPRREAPRLFFRALPQRALAPVLRTQDELLCAHDPRGRRGICDRVGVEIAAKQNRRRCCIGAVDCVPHDRSRAPPELCSGRS